MECDYEKWNVNMGPWNVDMGKCNMIMGLWNIKRNLGMWL